MKNWFKKRKKEEVKDYWTGEKEGVEVKRTEHRHFYDSTWEIKTTDFVTTIVRQDTETAENLLKEILDLPEISKESVLSLDERNKIYYD